MALAALGHRFVQKDACGGLLRLQVQWAILWAGESLGHALASSHFAGLGYYAEGAVETVERWHFGQVEVVVQALTGEWRIAWLIWVLNVC